MTHLLDTSAILAHYLGEPGAETVSELLAGGSEVACLAAPSWAELERRLAELIPDPKEAERIWRHYTQSLCGMLSLDQEAALAAIRIRRRALQRIPLVDALIAGTAAFHGLILVHRDLHMDSIPAATVKSLRLPDKWQHVG